MCGCLLCAPDWGPGGQPRHVGGAGMEPGTLWFRGRHPTHGAAPAWAPLWLLSFHSVFVYSRH